MTILKALTGKNNPVPCAHKPKLNIISVSFIFNWPSVITVFVMLDQRPVCQPDVFFIFGLFVVTLVILIEPSHDKASNVGFRTGPTQTGLYSE